MVVVWYTFNMLRRSLLLVVACVALVSCEDAKKQGLDAIGTIKDFGKTASGTVHDAKHQIDAAVKAGKTATDDVNKMIEDAKRRINQVQSGVDMLMRGKELIEDGVSGEEK